MDDQAIEERVRQACVNSRVEREFNALIAERNTLRAVHIQHVVTIDTLLTELKRLRGALETIAFSGATSDITASGGAPWYAELARNALQGEQ